MGSVFDGHGWSDRLSRDGCVGGFLVGRVCGLVVLIVKAQDAVVEIVHYDLI